MTLISTTQALVLVNEIDDHLSQLSDRARVIPPSTLSPNIYISRPAQYNRNHLEASLQYIYSPSICQNVFYLFFSHVSNDTEWPSGYKLSPMMLFVWQAPMMFMSYSWAMFLLALLLHVIRPLIEGHMWGDDLKVKHWSRPLIYYTRSYDSR